jgi:hypothetical protein
MPQSWRLLLAFYQTITQCLGARTCQLTSPRAQAPPIRANAPKIMPVRFGTFRMFDMFLYAFIGFGTFGMFWYVGVPRHIIWYEAIPRGGCSQLAFVLGLRTIASKTISDQHFWQTESHPLVLKFYYKKNNTSTDMENREGKQKGKSDKRITKSKARQKKALHCAQT